MMAANETHCGRRNLVASTRNCHSYWRVLEPLPRGDPESPLRWTNKSTRTSGLAAGRPVISVDTKKKELVGNYENAGRQWRKS